MLSEYSRIKVEIYNQNKTMKFPYFSIIRKITSKLPVAQKGKLGDFF